MLSFAGLDDHSYWATENPEYMQSAHTGKEPFTSFDDNIWGIQFLEEAPRALVVVDNGDEYLDGIHLDISNPAYDSESGVLTFDAVWLADTLGTEIPADEVTIESSHMLIFRNDLAATVYKTDPDPSSLGVTSALLQANMNASASASDALNSQLEQISETNQQLETLNTIISDLQSSPSLELSQQDYEQLTAIGFNPDQCGLPDTLTPWPYTLSNPQAECILTWTKGHVSALESQQQQVMISIQQSTNNVSTIQQLTSQLISAYAQVAQAVARNI